jgi:hypothetical protein
METKVIYCYAFICDMQEGKTYYCSTISIILMVDIKKAYINPFGRVSLEYEHEEDLIFPIQKQNGKIILMESKERLIPYHSTEELKIDIDKYTEIDLSDQVIEVVHAACEINSAELSYSHMGLLELENLLVDWYDVVSGSETDTPGEIEDIKKIVALIKEKISKATDKGELMKLFNNLSSSVDDYDHEDFTTITNELLEDCREKLIMLGKKNVVQKNDKQKSDKKGYNKWKDMKDEELQNIYADTQSSDDDIAAAENELRRRRDKK